MVLVWVVLVGDTRWGPKCKYPSLSSSLLSLPIFNLGQCHTLTHFGGQWDLSFWGERGPIHQNGKLTDKNEPLGGMIPLELES